MEQTIAVSGPTTYVSKYSTMNREDFKKLILMGISKIRYQQVYFVLNTLHNIVRAASYYCYCNVGGKCKICNIPIFLITLKTTWRKIFLISIFYFDTTLKFEMSCFNFLIKRKIMLNAFRPSTSSEAVTGTLASTGAWFFLKAFDTMKRSKLICPKTKNYLFLPNFKIKLLI